MKNKAKPTVRCDKPFPWRCPQCFEKAVNVATIQYRAKASYEGRVYEFDVPDLSIPKCAACGELVFGYKEGDQITQALGAHLRLLSHTEIRDSRKRLGLSQKVLAERLGFAEATICHWESGKRLQSRAMDNLLRVFFACPEARKFLCGESVDPEFEAMSESSTDFERMWPALAKRMATLESRAEPSQPEVPTQYLPGFTRPLPRQLSLQN